MRAAVRAAVTWRWHARSFPWVVIAHARRAPSVVLGHRVSCVEILSVKTPAGLVLPAEPRSRARYPVC